MTPDAYYWISIAYGSIAASTALSLVLKAYNAHKLNKSLKYSQEPKVHPKPMDYILHCLHIPPYVIASYWYYDSYLSSEYDINMT